MQTLQSWEACLVDGTMGGKEVKDWLQVMMRADRALTEGNHKDAEHFYRFAIGFAERKFGTDSLLKGNALLALSKCFLEVGKTDEAQTSFARAASCLNDRRLASRACT